MLPPVYAVRRKDNYLVESANYRALIVWCFIGVNLPEDSKAPQSVTST